MGESLSLRDQILEEISERKEARIKNEEEAEKKANGEVQQKILKVFKHELERLLRERVGFESFKIPDEYACRRYIRKVANGLGFVVEMVYSYEKKQHFFVFTVSEFQTGQRTLAQEMLKKFENDLEKARSWRRTEVREECCRILEKIKEKQYKDIYLDEKNKLIYIKSEEEQLDEDDKYVIFKFFIEYKLHFQTFLNGGFYFHL